MLKTFYSILGRCQPALAKDIQTAGFGYGGFTLAKTLFCRKLLADPVAKPGRKGHVEAKAV